jgi:hypothetical protein
MCPVLYDCYFNVQQSPGMLVYFYYFGIGELTAAIKARVNKLVRRSTGRTRGGGGGGIRGH